jgi:KDO2-lipid IV(A) lauroyltransferase
MSFSRIKNRAFAAYDSVAGWLARQPGNVRRTAYTALSGVMWVAYLLPGSRVRATFEPLSQRVGARSTAALYKMYVNRLMLGLDRAEMVRHGFGAEIDDLLSIPNEQRLIDLLKVGGVFLVLPHAHAALPMVRGLARRYPVLAIVRNSSDARRAEAQRHLYEQVGCDFVDARNEAPMTVGRKALRAFKEGRIVVGTVDRITPPPKEQMDPAAEIARVTAFGQPVGAAVWPARFARAAGVPILPAMVVQTDTSIELILGPTINPDDDLAATTQDWMSALEDLVSTYAPEWTFSLDKHWSEVLRSGATARQEP